jgi:hypothetical protein
MEEEKMVTIGDVVQPTTATVLLQLILFSMLFVLSLMAYIRATGEPLDTENEE